MKKIIALKLIEFVLVCYFLLTIFGVFPDLSQTDKLFLYSILALLGTVVFKILRKLTNIDDSNRYLDILIGANILLLAEVTVLFWYKIQFGPLFYAITLTFCGLQFIIFQFRNNGIITKFAMARIMKGKVIRPANRYRRKKFFWEIFR